MKQIITFLKSDFAYGGADRYDLAEDIGDRLLRVQVDNHIRLGLNLDDLILGANFDFDYRGKRAERIDIITQQSAFVNKIPSYLTLIDKLHLSDNLLLRDADTYQLIPFDFPEVKDIGYIRHSLPHRGKLQGGAVYVRPSGYDLLRQLSNEILASGTKKEESYMPSFYKRPENNCRLTVLDYSYNMFRQNNFKTKYRLCQKPVKLVHFHPQFLSTWRCFVEGINEHNVKVVPDDLRLIFDKHDLKPLINR